MIFHFQLTDWKGQGENKPCSPLGPWRGSKQSIPSNVIHSFPAAQPVGPLETAKSLGFSQTPSRPTPPGQRQMGQLNKWREEGPVRACSPRPDCALLAAPTLACLSNMLKKYWNDPMTFPPAAKLYIPLNDLRVSPALGLTCHRVLKQNRAAQCEAYTLPQLPYQPLSHFPIPLPHFPPLCSHRFSLFLFLV